MPPSWWRARAQGKVFPADRRVLRHAGDWTQNPVEGLLNIAQQAGFTQEKFDLTLKNETLAKDILEMREGGVKFGVNGTPTFFINGETLRRRAHLRRVQGEIDPLL